MGHGHDAVATELARRFQAGGHGAIVVDLLRLLPASIGAGLRAGYAGMLRRAPWSYELIYRTFFVPKCGQPPSISPLTRLLAEPVRAAAEQMGATAVVSTFHLGADVAGRLRQSGALECPSCILVTDFAVHSLWLSPGNDMFVTVSTGAADAVAAATGRVAVPAGPVVAPRFQAPFPEPAAVRSRLGLTSDRPPVLVTGGSWGAGDVRGTARLLAASGRFCPLVLCGGNERLYREIAALPGCLALRWRCDIPDLLAASCAVVENAGGSSAFEAFAAGVPVVTFRPIPGHGRDSAQRMADAGVTTYARSPAELVAALELAAAGKSPTVRAARALFQADAAAEILDFVRRSRGAAPVSAGRTAAAEAPSIRVPRRARSVPRRAVAFAPSLLQWHAGRG